MNQFVANMISKCVVVLTDSAKKLQSMQVRLLAGETKDEIELLQNYGFTSHPLPGAEGVSLFLQGDRSNGVVICVDDRRFRITNLKPGEVAIYTDEGDFIHFKRGRKIEIETESFTVNTKKFEVNTETLTFNSKNGSQFSQTINAPDLIAGGQAMHNHVHGGITPGGANTSTPK